MNQAGCFRRGGRAGVGYREEWFYTRPTGDAFSHSSFVLGFLAIGMDFFVKFKIKGNAPFD